MSGGDAQLVTHKLPLEEHREETSPHSFLDFPDLCTNVYVLQKQIQSLNKMCSNLLEKISKEERESESGGTEGWVAKWRRKRVRDSLE